MLLKLLDAAWFLFYPEFVAPYLQISLFSVWTRKQFSFKLQMPSIWHLVWQLQIVLKNLSNSLQQQQIIVQTEI